MDVSFGDNKLRKLANDERKAIKVLGVNRARLFKLRLNMLMAAQSLEDLRYAPGRFHELTANRKGQWACDLDHPYRLIFEPHEFPIPQNDVGGFVWLEIKGVEIIEIEDYH